LDDKSFTLDEVEARVEECLEYIYKLGKEKQVKTTLLAEATGYPASTITTLLSRLSKRGLVEYQAFKGARLTEKGRRLALEVIRRHRLSERMLTDILEMDWEDAHREACQLEHAISTHVARRLEEVLGYPKTCPHGNPIPDEEGRMPDIEGELLSQVSIPGEVVVVGVVDEDPSLLRNLRLTGILPGRRILVEGKSSLDGSLLLKIGKERVPLSKALSEKIRVRRVEV